MPQTSARKKEYAREVKAREKQARAKDPAELAAYKEKKRKEAQTYRDNKIKVAKNLSSFVHFETWDEGAMRLLSWLVAVVAGTVSSTFSYQSKSTRPSPRLLRLVARSTNNEE